MNSAQHPGLPPFSVVCCVCVCVSACCVLCVVCCVVINSGQHPGLPPCSVADLQPLVLTLPPLFFPIGLISKYFLKNAGEQSNQIEREESKEREKSARFRFFWGVNGLILN